MKTTSIITQAAHAMENEILRMHDALEQAKRRETQLAAQVTLANADATQAKSTYAALAAKHQRLQTVCEPVRAYMSALHAQNTALRAELASTKAENEALRARTRPASPEQEGERSRKRSRSSASDPNEVERADDAAPQQPMEEEEQTFALSQETSPQETTPQAVTPQAVAQRETTPQAAAPNAAPLLAPCRGFVLDDDDDDDDENEITIQPEEITVVPAAQPVSSTRPELCVDLDGDSDDGESRRWGENPPPPMRCTCELDECKQCNPRYSPRHEMDKDSRSALMFSGFATSTVALR